MDYCQDGRTTAVARKLLQAIRFFTDQLAEYGKKTSRDQGRSQYLKFRRQAYGQCGARALTGVSRRSPQRGPGAEPLVRRSAGKWILTFTTELWYEIPIWESGQMNPYFYYRALIRDSYLRKRANESLLLLQSSDTRFLSEKTKIANRTPINLRVRWKKITKRVKIKNINRPNVITVNFK